MIYNIFFIVLVLGSLVAGYFRGFGKCLKNLSGGVVGMVIAGAFCLLFGSTIMAIPAINKMIDGILAKIVYYIILFICAQALRWLIFTIIQKVMEAENPAMKIVNRVGGAALSCGLTVFSVIGLMTLFTRFSIFSFITDAMADSFLLNMAIGF